MKENTMRTMTAPNKKGPRKLKSWPLLAAQKVYRVRDMTTTAVKITDSRITFPLVKAQVKPTAKARATVKIPSNR